MELLCSSEWHFSRFKGAGAFYASLIFSIALHLSKTSGVFYASIPTLATHLGCDERTARKAISLLVENGFFILLSAIPGKEVRYKVLGHKVWASKNPDTCKQITEPQMPDWFGERDPLGKMLYAASGGNFKPYPNFIRGMRKTKHSDVAILAHWNSFLLGDMPTTGKQWQHGIYGRFMKYLKSQPVSSSNPSHPMGGVPLTSDVTSQGTSDAP